MRAVRMAMLAVACCATPAGAAWAGEPPVVYPQLDPATMASLLVVARTRPGAYLPQFPQCEDPQVLCMDPPPFWLDTEVLVPVHGALTETRIAAASTSHYGMPEERQDAAYLMRIDTDGRQFVMPRYQRAQLYPDRGGEYYLPLLGSKVHWLPCSVRSLAREVEGLRGVAAARIPRSLMDGYGIPEHPQLFKVSWRGAMPRYWIAVSDLRTHLAELPQGAPWTCEESAG